MYVHVGNLMENPEENCRSPAPGLLQVGDNSFAFFPRVRGAVVDTYARLLPADRRHVRTIMRRAWSL
jgi:hypothetical protein